MNTATYPTPVAPRLAALALAAFFTVTVLAGVNTLATVEAGTPQMAQQASAPQA